MEYAVSWQFGLERDVVRIVAKFNPSGKGDGGTSND
jgi:hypothetical protein